MKDVKSVILANLSEADERRFHAARVPYTGATGQRFMGPDEPYIATLPQYLIPAMRAMGWERVEVEEVASQWIVRRAESERGRRFSIAVAEVE